MSFTHLSQLAALRTTPVTEAKSQSSDFDGIRSVVDDCLEDLTDKIAALVDLAKATGAAKLDTVKDKDGMTVFKKLDKLTKDYTSAMKKLMTEAEALVMQVAEGEDADGLLLTEGAKDYADSAEFTDEFHDLMGKVNDIKRIVKAPRWMDYMVTTDHNFDTSCESAGATVAQAVTALDKAVAALEDEIDKAV
jgi:hypothetical protein